MNGTFRELRDAAEFVVDAQGRRKAVLLDYAVWKKLMYQIEDMEDSAEIEASRTSGEETVPWEEAKAELRAKGINV
ncbi:MAG: hypothetical protein F4Z82_17975 [Caldilineaceae bacterium SB0668_bin_21]|nr:hypothetical protein [Caldilineaceae bacterium SB0668_bin_21]MYC22121.1 hypothetical protein [Caldilineaceae bacterium SB0662_bin_25]